MKSLQTKKAKFTETELIVFRKKGDIIINTKDIKHIDYKKPNLLNYLLASTWFGGTYPGRLQVHLNKKIGKTKLYLVKIKYKEFLELPKIYREKSGRFY